MEVCEECHWRASSWRCRDCRQIYCSKCLLGLHSLGGPFSKHSAEPLPYFTPDMHKRFEEEELAYKLRAKSELLKHQRLEAEEKLKLESAVKLQAWWRMIMGRNWGRKFIKVCAILTLKKILFMIFLVSLIY